MTHFIQHGDAQRPANVRKIGSPLAVRPGTADYTSSSVPLQKVSGLIADAHVSSVLTLSFLQTFCFDRKLQEG